MTEKTIVKAVVNGLRERGFKVATEVANFHRSADVGAIDGEENVWIVECKGSNIGRAIEQSKTHKLAADRVFIATPFRKTKRSTLERVEEAGIGLFYVMPDGSLSDATGEIKKNEPWALARGRLFGRIMEGV